MARPLGINRLAIGLRTQIPFPFPVGFAGAEMGPSGLSRLTMQ